MAGKPLTALALRTRSLEWVVPGKATDKIESGGPGHLDLDLGADPTTLVAALRSDRDRLVQDIRAKHPLSSLPAAMGIPASWALLRIADFPTSERDELRGMVELQIDKFSPFPLDESVISYEIIQQSDGHSRVLLSAIPTATMNTIGDSLRSAGIRPKWVDLNLLGWWRLLRDGSHIREAGAQVHLILDQDEYGLIVTVRGVPVAMRALSGLEGLPAAERADEIHQEAVHTLASLNLEAAADTRLEVAVWHPGEPPTELLNRLAEAFVATPHSLESLPSLPEGLWRRAQSRTPGMLDLAPPAWQQAETSQRTRRRTIIAAGVVLGVWLVAMIGLFGGLQFQKQKLARQEARLAALAIPAEKVRAVRERALALEQYVDRTRSALDCLREISELLPPGIDLKLYTYHKGKKIELTGEADAVTLVYDFKKEMEKSSLFISTDLPRTVRLGNGKENFKLTAVLPGGETP